MKTRQLSIINCVSLLAALLLCQGTPTFAQGAKPDAAPITSSALQQPDQPRLVVQVGHYEGITSAAFSPDGLLLLTGSGDKTARLWETHTGREIRSFEGHSAQISSVAFSPDGRLVLTGSGDKTARLWDVETGREVKRFEGDSSGFPSASFSPDGRYVLTGSADKTARLWDVATGKELRRFEGHSNTAWSAAFSPDGGRVLTGSWDNTVRLWDAASALEVKRFKGYSGPVAFSPGGNYILATTGLHNNILCILDLVNGQEVRRFEVHKRRINTAMFSPDGGYVLTGSQDNTARIWDVETGRQLQSFEGHDGWVNSAIFSPDSRYVLTGSDDGTAWLWDAATAREIRRLQRSAAKVSAVAFSPDGRKLVTGSWDKAARLWDLMTGREVLRFEGHDEWISSVAFSPNGRYVATGSWDRNVRIWDAKSGREITRLVSPWVHDRIYCVAFSPNSRFILTGCERDTARLWDLRTNREVQTFHLENSREGIGDHVQSVAFSPKGSHILTGTQTFLRLWEISSAREIKRFKNRIASAAFSPDGGSVLTCDGWSKIARIWDVGTGNEVRRFDGHSDSVISVAFHPNGRYILTGSEDKTARLWEIDSGREINRFEGHLYKLTSVAFSPDGRLVLTSSADGTTRLWETASGLELASLFSFKEGAWGVVDSAGRFDASNLEEILGFNWIMPDDPLNPLPVEIFMRDYYEPRLLARVLAGEQFKPIRSLTELNRVQPRVEIKDVRVEDVEAGTVAVTVEVAGASGTLERDGKTVSVKTGVYDLRLFRDGQLVAQMPSPAYEPSSTKTSWEEELRQWRGTQEVVDFETGKKTLTFRGIQLPRRTGLKDVEFSAYAFNEDRIKSATSRARFPIPKNISLRQGRAYIIVVGVNAYETPDWDLRYAAKDAQYFSDILKPLLEKSKNYTPVVLVRLISDWTREQNGQRKVVSSDATKARFKAVLDLLAGRNVDPTVRASIPNADKLSTVQPEDLVFIAFSSHGYADQSGIFYLFPYDIGSDAGEKVTSELLKRTISSDELSYWIREIDAGEMVMVIDACHSAASVEGTGFKPGPMGARGLGQLAYDKGMRILASTRADDVAWESPLTKQGLLCYALVQNGLVRKQADFDPKDKKILLSEWLKYGVKRVPELYEEVRSGRAKGAEEKAGKLTAYWRGVVRVEKDAGKKTQVGVQQPSLFDFRRAVPYEPLITRLGE